MKKNKNNFDPFKDIVLGKEEAELEAAFERGDYEESDVEEFKKTKKMFEEAAERHVELKRKKPVTLRIKQLDLLKVKAKAERQQIPYQTLLGHLIHQYAEGQIKTPTIV